MCGSPARRKDKHDAPGLRPTYKREDSTYESLAGDFAITSAFHFDSVQLSQYFNHYPGYRPYEKDIRTFYQMRHYAFAWFDRQAPTEQAGNLYNRLRQFPTETHGDSLPYTSTLDSLLDTDPLHDPASRIKAELLLTSAYFFFAEHAWQGIDAAQTTRMTWFVPRKQADYASWLQGYVSGADTSFREPVYRQYNLLRGFLQRYHDLGRRGNWASLHPQKNVPLSMDTLLLREVRRRLILLGDLDTAKSADDVDGIATKNLYDSNLTAAIRGFQQRMGLVADGGFGPSTARALSISPEERMRTILVNMERSRWLPDTIRGNYLAVNIPEFRLHAYRDDSLLWDIKVVVGKTVHQTVIFSGTLRYIVFSPYWNVPVSIYQKEIRPGIARDPAYLSKHHMERFGDGVRQLPGPWNSLGGVKFLFPNSHSIYLHDTPAKTLFAEKTRAFSHGCIRLAEPAKLAAWLLRKDSTFTSERIHQAMNAGREEWVNVPGKIPVVIVYFTAWVDREGQLNFRNDIYGRDKRLAAVLLQKK